MTSQTSGSDLPPQAGGRLDVIGLGPGDAALVTPATSAVVADAEIFLGYGPYLDRLTLAPGQRREASDNREELDRAEAALRLAAEGRRVAVVSGGDPGVFAMAAAVCEAVEAGPAGWRQIEIAVHPGITAALAVAARAGAPLGHDFCVISLSDNLKPWSLVEARLKAAAEAGFAMALYNPISRARPWQLGAAFEALGSVLPADVPVIFGRALSRPGERLSVSRIAEATAAAEAFGADMATLVIVGSRETRVIARPGRPPLVYSPRSVTTAREAAS